LPINNIGGCGYPPRLYTEYMKSYLLIICFIIRMATAGTGAYIGQVVSYAITVFIVIIVVSFILGMIRSISRVTGPRNAYEHFQDAGTINQHLIKSLSDMAVTLETRQNKLMDAMNTTSTMKVNTCSIFDNLHDKYIASYSKDTTNAAEYKLPEAEQIKLTQNRAKNAEEKWGQEISMFNVFRKEKMLNCALVNASGASVTAEGFANADDTTIQTLGATLDQKLAAFKTFISAPMVANWLSDCDAIKGTAIFSNRYIHNAQVKSMIGNCISDMQKNTPGFKNMSAEAQGKQTELFDAACNRKYGGQLEPFQNYVNGDFKFPVPFPTASLTPLQVTYYALLSDAQDTINNFNNKINTIYQNCTASYDKMQQTNKSYQDYLEQMNAVQKSSDSTILKSL